MEQLIVAYAAVFVICTSVRLCSLVPPGIGLIGYFLEASNDKLAPRDSAFFAVGHQLLEEVYAPMGVSVIPPVGLYSERFQETTEKRVLLYGICTDARVPCFWSKVNGSSWLFVTEGPVSRAIYYLDDIISATLYELYAKNIPIFVPDSRLVTYYLRGSYGDYLEGRTWNAASLVPHLGIPGTIPFTSAAQVLEALEMDHTNTVAAMRKETRFRLHHAATFWGVALDRILPKGI